MGISRSGGPRFTPEVREFSLAITGVRRRIRAHMRERLHKFGVTPQRCSTLLLVGEGRATTISELADHQNADPAMISRMVDGLVREDLLRREPDPNDRRVARLSLTDAGTTLFDEIAPKANSALSELLSVYSKNELTTLLQLLHKLIDAAEPAAPASKGIP
jgi:DNA-binding MarR family transcriptional regulator